MKTNLLQELQTKLENGIPRRHPERICDDCGGANVVWFAPNRLWNKIVRSPDKGDPMLCPRCFIVRAEAMGIHEIWQVAPDGDFMEKDQTAIAGERTQPRAHEHGVNHWEPALKDMRERANSESVRKLAALALQALCGETASAAEGPQPDQQSENLGSERGGILFNGKTAKEWFKLHEVMRKDFERVITSHRQTVKTPWYVDELGNYRVSGELVINANQIHRKSK